jgi:hypothetical protein
MEAACSPEKSRYGRVVRFENSRFCEALEIRLDARPLTRSSVDNLVGLFVDKDALGYHGPR